MSNTNTTLTTQRTKFIEECENPRSPAHLAAAKKWCEANPAKVKAYAKAWGVRT